MNGIQIVLLVLALLAVGNVMALALCAASSRGEHA